MAALLKQASEAGMQVLEACQRRERVGNPTKVSLADGDEVQDVAVLRDFRQQGGGGRQGLCELLFLDQPANAAYFRFYAGFGWIRRRGCHEGSRDGLAICSPRIGS